MNHQHEPPAHALTRRTVLRAAGVALCLPLLESLRPLIAAAEPPAATPSAHPMRMVLICAPLGFLSANLIPAQAGRAYTDTPYLSLIAAHRKRFTVLSGLSHPEQNGANGHSSLQTWLTSAKHPGLAGFRNTVSIDQVVAEHLGKHTRLPTLNLSSFGQSLSFTANGTELPAESSPAAVFAQMFLAGTPAQIAAQTERLRQQRSILDALRTQSKRLANALDAADRDRLDQYQTAIRDLEERLHQSEAWSKRPKPTVSDKAPNDVTDKAQVETRTRQMLDLLVLALNSDSTRIATYLLHGFNAVPAITGVSQDWHQLSHHGKDPSKIAELEIIERLHFTMFNDFLGKLAAIPAGDGTLLDRTMVLLGSNLGNANSHESRNLPLVLAGGGFAHGQHLAFDPAKNLPFANLLAQIGARMGAPIERFGSSTAASVPGLA